MFTCEWKNVGNFNIDKNDIIALKNKKYVGYNPSFLDDELFICDYRNKNVKWVVIGDLVKYYPIVMGLI